MVCCNRLLWPVQQTLLYSPLWSLVVKYFAEVVLHPLQFHASNIQPVNVFEGYVRIYKTQLYKAMTEGDT